MEHITVHFETESPFRATEIAADLQNVAQALYHPLRAVTYYDASNGDHNCLPQRRGLPCLHNLPPDAPDFEDYDEAAARDFRARLRVDFPHAKVRVYLR
ncbi:MAG: hypothetical protein NTZ05_02685 [Chloroflexi bacterium]|nr:hypothetical protein [Chloroflexota bacterium]